jgi:hypothetical protein
MIEEKEASIDRINSVPKPIECDSYHKNTSLISSSASGQKLI